MAMTKAEKALLDQFRERAALTLPPYERPKPARVDGGNYNNPVPGWFCNVHSREITHGCSNGISHSRFRTDRTESQGHGVMYATKFDAAKALRWAVTEMVMSQIAAVDALVEREMAAALAEKEG